MSHARIKSETAKFIKNVNRLFSIFNDYYHLGRISLIVGGYEGTGVIYILAPKIKEIIEKTNSGTILFIVPELEWLICAVYNTTQFRFCPYPIDITLPDLKEDVIDVHIVELISELVIVTLKLEREKKK